MPRQQPSAAKKAKKTAAPVRRAALRAVRNNETPAADHAADVVLAAPRTRVPIVAPRKHLESEEQQMPRGRARRLPSTGKARLEAQHFEVVDRAPSKEKLEALRFNEDVLTIRVHETTDKNAHPLPEVWNDGIVQRFRRGVEQKVKRKFVEILARQKVTTYTQEKTQTDGVDDIINVPHTAVLYPFAVLHDPAGAKGAAWLKGILEEA